MLGSRAGHAAVAGFALPVLARGCDLYVLSTGALAEELLASLANRSATICYQ